MNSRETLRADEIAQALDISVRSVYAACARGDIPHIRGIGEVVRIPRWWLTQALACEPEKV